MYAPIFQSGSSDSGTGLQCIIVLVILAIVWAVLANLKSKTQNAAPYSQAITSSLPREQITKIVQDSFPKSIVTSSFSWKLSWPTPDRLTMSGYYLTNGQGCLVLLLTGIIPGALLIRFAMGQTEQVTVDFSKFQTSGELILEAKGLRAQQQVNNLATKLGAKVEASSEVVLETRRAQVAADLCPKCGNKVSPADQNCPSCRINLTFAREHPDQL